MPNVLTAPTQMALRSSGISGMDVGESVCVRPPYFWSNFNIFALKLLGPGDVAKKFAIAHLPFCKFLHLPLNIGFWRQIFLLQMSHCTGADPVVDLLDPETS